MNAQQYIEQIRKDNRERNHVFSFKECLEADAEQGRILADVLRRVGVKS